MAETENRRRKCEGRRAMRREMEKRRKADGGFTLIELLTVLVIIMILVGIIVGASKYAQVKGGNTRSQAEIAALETALESYKNDNGSYPMSTPPPGNATNDSILLYNALVAGPKKYISFKPTEMRDGGNLITIPTFVCGTNSFSPTVTNVMVIDPFGHPYNYFNPCSTGGANNQVTFDLWSNGPSGTNGAVDSITNWKPN
jgi:general secretion pathway protein G